MITVGSSWRSVAGVLACAALIVAAFSPSFASMFRLWDNSSYNHGYLIPLISAFLLAQDRERLTQLPWKASWWGLAAFLATLLVWNVGRGTAVQAVEHVAAIGLIVTFVWAVAGTELLRAAWFPLLFLFLATPIGEGIVPLLQTLTSDVAVLALNIIGIPVFRDGTFISLPGGEFEVARACSGLRYLYAGIAMAVLMAYVIIGSAWLRVVYVGVIALVFIVMNGIRAFIVMWIASATDMRYMTGEDHVTFGYVLFFGITVLAFWIATRLEALSAPRRTEANDA